MSQLSIRQEKGNVVEEAHEKEGKWLPSHPPSSRLYFRLKRRDFQSDRKREHCRWSNGCRMGLEEELARASVGG
ncbi:hypothetical protein MA16_Dca011110 [Dendrobium catenatum]|uniref:Uncharacterized protein n=1 Tax=Dendrobium catenatum TaxID=906689 RepID=A0A2I0WSD8_9ASPA|nr:hypothetical protein MA16_Dca011110 [Dendrobium catenatum]